MLVALLHNPSSGSEDHTDREIVKGIRQAGHEVPHVSASVRELTAALQREPCDLILIAGGDGTVSRAACQLAGWRVPLSILPLGTANNTAKSLSIPKRIKKLAKSWQSAERLAFDLAVLDDGVVRQRYAEAAGWGVFPSSIERAKREGSASTVRRTLKRNQQLFRQVAREAQPRPYRVEVDGRDYSGDYLLVEVVNVPLIGPQLPLSPFSDPSDGSFEVVLAGCGERAALERLASGERVDGAFVTQRGAHVRVTASEGVMHVDGRLLRHPLGGRDFEVRVEAQSIEYLGAAPQPERLTSLPGTSRACHES